MKEGLSSKSGIIRKTLARSPKGASKGGQPMEKFYIGMDIHNKKTMYVIQNEQGSIIGRGSVDTTKDGYTALFIGKEIPPDTEVAIESGEKMYWANLVLMELRMRPVVISAQEVRARARRPNQKSDYRDALEICDGLRRGIYTSIVYVPPPEVQHLREILSRRQHFVKECTRQRNAAKFLIRTKGITLRKSPNLRTITGWEQLINMKEVEDIRGYLGMHYQIWKTANEFIGDLEKKMDKAGEPFKKLLDLLQTMPGVGVVTSTAFVSSLGDAGRFRTSSEVASYIGLVPSTYDSGEKQRHGHITKSGSSYMRSLLCEAAHHAGRSGHPLNALWKRHIIKGGYKKTVTIMAHRMARILFAMWRHNEAFDPNKMESNKPQPKKATRTYRIKSAA